MLLPREEGAAAAKASKGGLYYNGVSSLLCHPHPSFFFVPRLLPPLVSSRLVASFPTREGTGGGGGNVHGARGEEEEEEEEALSFYLR